MAKGKDRATFATEAAAQVYNTPPPPILVYLAAAVCENADLTVEINRRVLRANLLYVSDGMASHCTAPAKGTDAEIMETMLYGCVTWSPTVVHLAIIAHGSPPIAPPLHRMQQKNVATDITCHPRQTRLPRLGVRTSRRRCERGGKFSRGPWLLRTDNERLPKRAMFGEVEGGERFTREGKNRTG